MQPKPKLRPIVIAGPTGSGKSALALALAEEFDGVIVNADALQVYACWQVLTARPGADDLARAPHRLYGHVSRTQSYSVGDWLRELALVLSEIEDQGHRAIIVGGTGLYLSAATLGLADVPRIPAEVRHAGDALRIADGALGFRSALLDLDPYALDNIDKNNPARLQRAWEVLTATGKPLRDWHKRNAAPLIAPDQANLICVQAPPDWLNPRIDQRLEAMIREGALTECARALEDGWDPALPSSRALGAAEFIAHLRGEMPLDEALNLAKIATHQYAKRQRSWFRSKMADWVNFDASLMQSFSSIFNTIR